MSKPMLFLAKTLMAAAITVFATAQTSEAQRRGGGWYGGGAGWHGGGGGWHGGWHGGGRGNWWGGFGVGVGVGVGYLGSGWGGYPYYGGGWGGYPYYSTGYYYPDSYAGYYSPDYYTASTPYDTSSYSYYPPLQEPSNNTAMIQVYVPPDATVSFDGTPTNQRGSARLFNTPPLTPGSTYTYNIQASWMANGQPVTQTRQVQVQAGRQSTVNFNVAGS
jgi:uncharacterized protein (TIGR03000 family)